MDLSRWIDRHAVFTPDKPAIVSAAGTLSYADMAGRVAAVARLLKSAYGVDRGDRVAHLGYNSADMLVVLFACARLGAMFVPMNWRLAPPEHAFILSDAAVKVLVADTAFNETIAEVTAGRAGIRAIGLDGALGNADALDDLLATPDVRSGDDCNPHVDLSCPFLIVYTSGTTGQPKGAVLTQRALFWNAVQSTHMHDLTGRDRILTVLPMFHVGGLNIQTLPGLHAGATVLLHDRFDPGRTLAAIAADRPTLTVLVPATLEAVLRHPAFPDTDLSSLRLVTTGSSMVPQDLIDAYADRGVTMIQVYGSTETAPIAIYQQESGAPFKPGSTGRQGLHCDAMVVGSDGRPVPDGSDGEILVRGPQVMFEYWGNSAATTEALRDGWFHTGDIGYRDADGDYFIHDRKKNMIISGGENIYPAEVERVLRGCPGVADVAVVGRPDPKWGETPVAVILAEDGGEPDPDAVLGWLHGRIARFKHPREVMFVRELPRNAMGKVQHHRVRDMIDARDRSC
ncbi:AMP-binding protein [Fodinicurvata sp. EGI_FJ10296]|uniref:class I adenylate-forming enzyme family protein n=1 Tax=Fodinicurvata sp. EGI_FJ10296 TaxID=3231908 RepID=UPI003453BECA